MTENLELWLIPIISIPLSLILGYLIGNQKAKKDKLLERRTEIFENILRSLSNFLNETSATKAIKASLVEITQSGIGKLLEEYEPKYIEAMKVEVKQNLHEMGADATDNDVETFLKKFLLSWFEGFYMSLSSELIQTRFELDEELMALQMYLTPEMRDKLGVKVEEFDKIFEKYQQSKIDEDQLFSKTSELAEVINEIMKFN
jgi:hypothetical protein